MQTEGEKRRERREFRRRSLSGGIRRGKRLSAVGQREVRGRKGVRKKRCAESRGERGLQPEPGRR